MNLLNEKIEITDLSKKITINNETASYQVYKIPLSLLFYNDQNDRIATWLSQYKDEMRIDEIDKSNKEEYNKLIHSFITASNPERIKKTQTNIKLVGQREPGVVLKDGRIIDGNRRFTCLRNLQKEGEEVYFEAIILTLDVENDAKAIKMLELNLQHGEDAKVDYNPIDKLVGVYNDLVLNKLLTVKEYAESVNKTEKEIEKDKDMALLMVDFLNYINGDGKFYLARNLDIAGPLLELQAMVGRVEKKQLELLKNAVFANLLFEPVGDMTRYIRKIKKLIGTKYLDKYLADHSKRESQIKKVIPNDPSLLSYEYINRKIRIRTEISQMLKNDLENALNDSNKDDARTRLVKLSNESFSKLQDMDLNMLNKLDKIQLKDLEKSLSKIEKMCKDIKEKIKKIDENDTKKGLTVEEAKKVIEELKSQGETEDDIVGIFFSMFQDDKLTLEEFEDLIGLMDYELTDKFKKMSPEQQKSDEAWEYID